MDLTQELLKVKAHFRSQVPEDIKARMDQATSDLIHSGLAESSPQAGDILPGFALPNAAGETVKFSTLLVQGPVVISFYRGGWCPYCNLELRALQEILPDIEAKGAQLVAISPETPDNSLSTQEKNDLTFQVLSDEGNRYAKDLGLVFTLPADLRPIYANFGIDLTAHNGNKSFELPLPATYVVAPSGEIILAFASADYTERLALQDILNALDRVPVGS
ncbi:MAG: peroxiredoxin-like family protein [Cyanobacteria bacterium P01_H01_bin.15]